MLDGRSQASGVRRHAVDETMLLLINAFDGGVEFNLPPGGWKVVFSSDPELAVDTPIESDTFVVPPRTFLALAAPPTGDSP